MEAFHYMTTGKQIEDEYKGEINHLAYNCKAGHLPPKKELECKLMDLWIRLNDEKVKAHLVDRIRHEIETYYGVND